MEKQKWIKTETKRIQCKSTLKYQTCLLSKQAEGSKWSTLTIKAKPRGDEEISYESYGLKVCKENTWKK